MTTEPRSLAIAGVIAVMMAISIGLGLHQSALNRAALSIPQGDGAAVATAWDRRLQRARELAATTVMADLHCTLKDGTTAPLHSSGDGNTDALLAVSEQPLVVFLLPGFDHNHRDGIEEYGFLQNQFADEIAAAREQPGGSAVCIVPWATQKGFGDDTPFLARAVGAVRELSEDPLLPSAGARRVVVLGYSAGGNFAEYALTHLPSDPAGGTADLRLVTLGAPHHGTAAASAYAGFLNVTTGFTGLFGALTHDAGMQRRAAEAQAQQAAFTGMRGYRQLQPDDPDVAALNARMAEPNQPFHYLNVYSSGDDAVAKDSAIWPGAVQADLVSYRHTDLPKAPVGSPWRRVLAVAFGPEALAQDKVDMALAAGTQAPPVDSPSQTVAASTASPSEGTLPPPTIAHAPETPQDDPVLPLLNGAKPQQ